MLFQQIVANIDWKTAAAVVAAAAALATLIKGTLEYVKQGAQKRTELLLQMRDRWRKFTPICELLDHQGMKEHMEELRLLPYREKLDFVGLYEEIALMTESGLIRRPVAHYVFGYHAIKCSKCDVFWNDTDGLNRDSPNWRLFHAFAKRMQEEQKALENRKFEPRKYRM